MILSRIFRIKELNEFWILVFESAKSFFLNPVNDNELRIFLLDEVSVVFTYISAEDLSMIISVLFEMRSLETVDIFEYLISSKHNQLVSGVILQELPFLLESDPVLAVSLLCPLLKHSENILISSVDSVLNTLNLALESQIVDVQRSALRTVSEFDEYFCSPPLSMINSVFSLLSNAEVANDAVYAFSVLISEIDVEIPNLLESILGLFQIVDHFSFVFLLTKALSIHSVVSDEIIQQVLSFVHQIFASDHEILLRTLTLKLVCVLISIRNTLYDEFSHHITQTLSESTQETDPLILSQTLDFMRDIVCFPCDNNVVFDYFSFVASVLQSDSVTEVRINSLLTLSEMTRISHNLEYFDLIYDTTLSFIKYAIDIKSLILIFKENEITDSSSKLCKIFDELINICLYETDHDSIVFSLNSTNKIFSKCFQLASDHFMELLETFIMKCVEGNIAYMSNSLLHDGSLPLDFIGEVLHLIGKFLKYESESFVSLFQYLIEWFQSTSDESVLARIVLCFSDFFSARNITDETIFKSIFQKVQGAINSDLQQNIVYFLCGIASHQTLVDQFIPIIDEWWKEFSLKESGKQQMLSTIGTFYLCYYVYNQTNPDFLLKGLSVFPPPDFRDTKSMVNSLLQIFSSEIIPEFCYVQLLISLATFHTEEYIHQSKRKIDQNSIEALIKLFRFVYLSHQDSEKHVLEKFSNNSSILTLIFSIINS